MKGATLRFIFALGIGFGHPVLAQPQRPDVPADAFISLERPAGSCAVPMCPHYTLGIDASGAVTYDGRRGVRVVGRRTTRIRVSAVAAMLARAEEIGFFDLDTSNDLLSRGSNPPFAIVSVTANGRMKCVAAYSLQSLADFARDIDTTVRAQRWVFLDEDTLQDLRRSGWSAFNDEGATLLQQAIHLDDRPITRQLIDLGADLGGPAQRRVPPFFWARSGAMVDLLVKAGADPNERPSDPDRFPVTPLIAASWRDVSVTEALPKAGARVDDAFDGRTALWKASCAGNWRVVSALLAAGGSPLGSMGISAVECARDERQRAANRDDFDRVIALLAGARSRIKR
jgi:hypothetical protein